MAKVIIYSKDHCPYCDRAKSLFQSKNQPFEEICFKEDNMEDFKKLQQKTGMRTVPQIFIDDVLIGGFQELSELDRQGQLDKLLI